MCLCDTGEALQTDRFKRADMVCTKTFYNYVDLEILAIKNANYHKSYAELERLQEDKKAKKLLVKALQNALVESKSVVSK